MKVTDHLLFVTNSKLGHGPRRRTTHDLKRLCAEEAVVGGLPTQTMTNVRELCGEPLQRVAVAVGALAADLPLSVFQKVATPSVTNSNLGHGPRRRTTYDFFSARSRCKVVGGPPARTMTIVRAFLANN
jgi:hypothetical protein